MTVVRFDALDLTDSPNGNASAPIATASRGASEVSVIRQHQLPGGFNPSHTHDREEVLVLLGGSLDVTAGDETHTLHAGDTIVVPANTAHQLRNAGDEPAEWLLVAPAGYRFYRESGEDATPAWSR
jgi:quercetin dioxygenase-like cupin family protein